MRNPYVVVLGEGFPRKNLLEQMDKDSRFGYWFFSMPSSFIVYSSVDANAIDAFIKEKIGDKYRYFITEISSANHQGWMPREHWAIIRNKGIDRPYDLTFKGYYRDERNLPHESGIYCVYRGAFNQPSNSVTIHQLLYIGSARDIYQRHTNHENKPEWLKHLSGTEALWFSCAPLPEDELARCEAALIFLNKPACNHMGDKAFHYLDTEVNVGGDAAAYIKGGVVEKCGPL